MFSPNAEYLHYGIVVYRDVFTKEMDLKNRLEKSLSQSEGKYKWNQAQTGYAHTDLKYRDAHDFKIKRNSDDSLMLSMQYVSKEDRQEAEIELEKIWEDSYTAQLKPVEEYRNAFGLAPLNYWESFNFVKYGPGQHFQVHSDHGYSYICVLSSVGYINDDYEGGELFFDKFNLKIKPKAGDLYLFPSSYIYSHSAMPVTEGTKYSIVTMLDYLEAPHTPDYRDIEKRYTEGYA
jgi:hypothetical protein